MKALLNKTIRLADSASLFAANIAAIVLLVLVALTCVDVIGRYLFNSPLIGAVELVRICMAGIIFFSFPYMFLRSDHIIVDLFSIFRRGLVGWVIGLAILAVIIYISLILGDRVYDYAVRALEDGDTTEYLAIPRVYVVGVITAAIFSAAFVTALKFISVLIRPGSSPEDPMLNDEKPLHDPEHGEAV